MNLLTVVKLALVIFMIALGFWHMSGDNFIPLAPYGTAGVLRGSTAAVFAYLGYDEVRKQVYNHRSTSL